VLGIFVAQPWLALIPAAAFLLLYRRSGRRLVAATAVVWLLYAGYEYGMRRRRLCSGECNIRVDLLLLYPALIVISVTAVVVAILALSRRRHAA
jgi:hypothetical protein